MCVFQVKNCTVHITDDSVFEPEEEFQVHLGTPLSDHWSGAMVGANDIVTVTITNDEDGKQALDRHVIHIKQNLLICCHRIVIVFYHKKSYIYTFYILYLILT